MARKHNPQDIEQLKRNVSILHICADHGIELKRHGTHDYVGRCPFHEDDKPSFVVTPSKNLWHCMGCDKGGSVIDLVMQLEGLTFPQAVDKLLASNGLIHRGSLAPAPEPGGHGAGQAPTQRTQSKKLPEEKLQQILERVTTIYQGTFPKCPEGRRYLEHRGITDIGLVEKHRIGYCNGRLKEILPENGGVRDDLKRAGILLKGEQERFTGCLVFPVLDVEGNITTLYGRKVSAAPRPSPLSPRPSGEARHLFLPGRHTGLWNVGIIKTCSDIILVESVLDALSVEVAGSPNVVAIQGTNGLSASGGDEDIALFKEHGVQKLTLLLDADDAGEKSSKRLKEKLLSHSCKFVSIRGSSPFSCRILTLPDSHDPNSYLMEHGAEGLKAFLSSSAGSGPESTLIRAGSASVQPRPETPSTTLNASTLSTSDGFTVAYGLRKYQVIGLDKGPRKLKATVRVESASGGKLHVDTLDFYSARSRRLLAQDLCRIFEQPPETIEADVNRLLLACEKADQAAERKSSIQDPVSSIGPKDRREAEAFGRSPDIIRLILDDFKTRGLIGEEPNKVLGYLAMTSRKMAEPLSMLILSSSGAGKTALQDAVCSFCPPEDLVKLTSLSGKALFYKDQLSLKHKVLALEEGDGAEEASYAIRSLISSGELVSESTIKDLATGRLTTMNNRVEGPTPVFYTTTNPDIDPETKSRFFVTSIDESREQTRRILAFQRRKQTLKGLGENLAVETMLRRHRNFQRLLKPVEVVNSYGNDLTYGDDRLQGRRDQPKYLNLIKAVAFLRQMSRQTHTMRRNGDLVAYIEVQPDDIVIANRLADDILGHSLDEMSRPGRDLLMEMERLVAARAEAIGKRTDGPSPSTTGIVFSRRDIREFTGWANARVHRYLKELVELEYVLIDSGRNGTVHRYRLAYEGQGKNGEKFMMGLIDVSKLKRKRR